MFRLHPPTATRLAGLGAATALAAGLLVTAPGAAHADGSTPSPTPTPTPAGPVHYSCTGPLGLIKVGVTVDVTNLPDQAPTELPLPQGIRFDVSLDFSNSAFAGLLSGGLPGLGGLGGLGGPGGGGLGGVLSGLSLSLGGDDLSVSDLTDTVDDPATDPVLSTAGSTDGLTLPSPGQYDVTLPDSFTFSPLSFLSLPILTVTCTQTGTGDGAVDTVDVTKQRSQTATSLVRSGRTPVVVARVARQLGEAGRGTVVATVGHRVVGRGTLQHGTARLPLHGATGPSVTVTYLGNRSTKASHDVVRVTG